MKVVAVIQARMGSSRLPGKVLMTLLDRPVIQWVHERALRIPGVEEVVVATSTAAVDDPLAYWCQENGASLFRGSADDVLDRYTECARRHHADVVVRITADCPLLDPAVSGSVLRAFLGRQGCDYASNTQPPTFPDGLDTEVMSRQALEASARGAVEQFDREHVTQFIRRHPERFPAESVVCEQHYSGERWTLDELTDLVFLSAVAQRLRRAGASGSMEEVLAILDAEPELRSINSGIARNAGAANAI